MTTLAHVHLPRKDQAAPNSCGWTAARGPFCSNFLCSLLHTLFGSDLIYTTSFSPAHRTHLRPRFKCSVHLHGSGASLLLNTTTKRRLRSGDRQRERGSTALEPQTAGSTASVRTVVLTSEQAVKEDKATVSAVSDVQEISSEDAVLRVLSKKTKQREPLTGFERRLSFATCRDEQSSPLQRRSNQVRRLVVQAQVVHGCSRLSVPVRRPDLTRHSCSHRSHAQCTAVQRLRQAVHRHGTGQVLPRWNQRGT